MSDKSALTALIGYLAAWEDREGAMAAMMPHEYEPFMEGLKTLCVRHTPRTARHELSALAQPDAQAQQPEDESKDALASRLIDAWCADKGRKIPWAKCVEIVAIVTGQTDAERDRLLKMGDENGSCEMCGRSDTPAGADNYVAFCRYVEHPNYPTRILLCDSDSEGAFKVYRQPVLAPQAQTRREVVEEAANVCERMRPHGGRAWTEGQAACFAALTDAAENIRALAAPAAHPAAHQESATQRRVVCAAIRASDGELLLGIRHYSRDMHRQIEARMDASKFQHRHDEDQGFVDQHGVWMTRKEAWHVALDAGQIIRPEACGKGFDGPKLYSEGLY